LYGGTTAKKAHAFLFSSFKENPPTQTQVSDALRNFRRRQYRDKSSADLLDDFRTKNSEKILYWEFREDEKALHFTIALSSSVLLDTFLKYGQKVFGLDGVYKYTDCWLPVWTVVVNTPLGATVVGYIVSTEGTHEYLRDALAALKPEGIDKAYCMIDHDDTEKKALTELEVRR